MRTTGELRDGFLRFYEQRGHLHVPSHSLIPPPDDASTLFIVAGMQPFKPYFLALAKPPAPRVVSVQKVLRAGGKDTDLADVGRTDRHCSFFEMLGNFSFGDYFKREAVEAAWEFATAEMRLDPSRLWATVHEGDPLLGLPEDGEAIAAWLAVGMAAERIVRLGEDNFWQAAEIGPCGPCSELFYDRGPEHGCGRDDCRPGCSCDRYMEFYNLVFMAFDRKPGNRVEPLPAKNVDTGLGLERGACLLQGVDSVFDTDGFRLIMDWVERESGVAYGESPQATKAHRVLADHGRAMSFLIADGVTPSNEGRGYVCRRVIRRAVQHAQRIGLHDIHRLTRVVCTQMGEAYPELREHAAEIERTVELEERRFGETLARGIKEFDLLSEEFAITAEQAFTLATTYGFPIELTEELAEERGQAVDRDGFDALMQGHREISRGGGESSTAQFASALVGPGLPVTRFVGYESTDLLTAVVAASGVVDGRQAVKLERSPFYPAGGGQVSDTGVLRLDPGGEEFGVVEVLRFGTDQVIVVEVGDERPFGEGSLERPVAVQAEVSWAARFPTMANHTATHLLQAALREVLGNHVTQAGSAVRPDKLRFDFRHTQPLSDAERDAVERLVNEKVFAAIPVRTFLTDIDEARRLGAMMLFGEKYGSEVRVVEIDGFSRELCGGTHVRSTAEVGPFVITAESSVGAGARRIEAVTSGEAWALLEGRTRDLDALRGELEHLRRDSGRRPEPATTARPAIDPQVEVLGGVNVIVQLVDGLDAEALLELSDRFKQSQRPAAVVLGSSSDGTVHLVANFDDGVAKRISAGSIVKEIAPLVGGGGGGRPTMARAGGKDPSGLPGAAERARALLAAALAQPAS